MRIKMGLRQIAFAWLLIIFVPISVFGQSKSLENLHRQWQELNQKLDDIESKIEAGDTGADAMATRKNLLADARRMVETLESAARAKLSSNGPSKLAFQLLMGIALDAASKSDDSKTLELGQFLIQQGINRKYFEIASKSDRLSIAQREIFDELQIRHDEAMANDLPRVKIETSKGDIVVELFENEAPGTVGNFISLCESGFYDKRIFHRVIEGFIAQTGGKLKKEDPEGDPGYQIKCECYRPDKRQHFTGCLSMAHKMVRDSGSSQFFFAFDRTEGLDGLHTVFGRVVDGHDILENLERTHVLGKDGRDVPLEGVLEDRILSVKVLRKRDHPYVPVKADKGPGEKAPPKKSEDAGLELNSPDNVDK